MPGLELDTLQDPVLSLVAARRRAKATGNDAVFARLLHVITDSLVSGNPSRMDEIWRRDNKGWHRWEGPAFRFMPIAVSVQGGAHLLLAVLERMVVDLGGCVAYRDTHSSLVPVSPEGGRCRRPPCAVLCRARGRSPRL